MHQRSYVAAGVDDLCRLAEARKGSFYHFFPGKSDLAIAALEHQWAQVRTEVFEPIGATGSAGLDRIQRLVAETERRLRTVLSAGQAVLGCPFGHLGQEMAHQDSRIQSAVRTIFDAHCHFLEAWLDEAVRARQVAFGPTAPRARQIFAVLEGGQLLAKVAGDPGVFAEACAAIPVIAGRVQPAQQRAIGTPPELL